MNVLAVFLVILGAAIALSGFLTFLERLFVDFEKDLTP